MTIGLDNKISQLLGRGGSLFEKDFQVYEKKISEIVQESEFLVLGGAGTIGQAVVKELFKREPKKLHVVDLNENNLVELVRDLRSSLGYLKGDFRTFVIDISSQMYDCFIDANGNYDFVFNLSALKHVRSEKDPFTLMRMIQVNILNTDKTINQSIKSGVKKYFAVSTDKAANPVNMMGASKQIMEMFMMQKSQEINISSARFANVAFSDGSLLGGLQNRLNKLQPIAGPSDIKRYFISPRESGELCLFSALIGENRDIFFPKETQDLSLRSINELIEKFLEMHGFKIHLCDSEDEARNSVKALSKHGKWPCYFSTSNTSGEKKFEEFYMKNEFTDLHKFENFGVIKNDRSFDKAKLENFKKDIEQIRLAKNWNKEAILNSFMGVIDDFEHLETNLYLDSKM